MQRPITILFLCFFAGFLTAQKSNDAKRLTIHQNARFIEVDLPAQSTASFLKSQLHTFGLDQDDALIKVKEIKGNSGLVHIKYQQEYKGLIVKGAQYILHSQDGLVDKANGYIAPDINLDIRPQFDQAELQPLVTEFIINEIIGVDKYLPQLQVEIHETSLCVIDQAYPEFSGNYKLAYQTFAEANTNFPVHERIFIDAHTGSIISNFTEVCDHSVPAKVETRYYGSRDLIADSIAPNQFVLRDSTRMVFTLNGPDRDNELDLDYPDFYDADNVWDNVNNDFNEVAGDAHFCTTAFHDFLLDEFGWKGLDNEGGDMISVVHANRRFYTNAFWDGSKIFIGNGDCDDYGPLTVLDVVGHEYTHGMIDYNADLVYQDESGALNESIADIFGKALEYKVDPANFNWLIGSRFRADEDKGFRDMKDPNEERDPKFYNGEHWHYSSSDRGGVHTNSGVFNYWFYLLVEGETGTNEVGYEYNVEAIGIDDALQIVYGSLTGYFTESTDYIDAMALTLEQTQDLYGINSAQYEAVLEAWTTVGLYSGIDDFDLSLEVVDEEYFGCPDSEIFPNVIVRNSGRQQYDAGTVLNLVYLFDGDLQEVREDVLLDEDLLPGDSIFYTFLQPLIFDPDVRDDISILVENIDNLYSNNLIDIDLEFSDTFGSDLDLTAFEFRIDDPCNPMAVNSYRIGYTNDGCMPIVEADSVMLKITTDLEEFTVPYTVYNSIDPGNVVVSFRNLPGELIPGFTSFKAEIIFDRDSDQTNNIVEGTFQIPEGISEGYLEEFDESDYREKLNINTSSFAGLDSVMVFKENEMFAITSKRTSFSYEDCADPIDFFDENNSQSTISACLDATGMEEPVFGMKIAQVRNGEGTEIDPSYRAMVKVSNDSLSYPIIFNQPNESIVEHEFALPVGFIGNFKIEVFVYSGASDAFTDLGLDKLDAVLFDRLELFDKADRPELPTYTEYEVYPTLVEENIQINTPDINEPYRFTVFDVLGRLVYTNEFLGHQNISLHYLTAGGYFFRITESKERIKVGKFVIVD